MNRHEGLYFDGQTSYPYKAYVELLDGVLFIRYYDKTERPQEIQWFSDNLHSIKLTDDKRNILKYGAYPHQSLEVDSEEFTEVLKLFYPKLQSRSYDVVIKNNFPMYWTIAGIIILILTMLFI